MTVTSSDWSAIAPSLIVMLTGMFVVGFDLFRPPPHDRHQQPRGVLVALSYLGLAVPAALVLGASVRTPAAIHGFGSSVVLDDLSCFLGLAILGATALILVGADADTRRRQIAVGEYYGLVLTSAGAMMLLVSSTDFLMIFLNLEILSLALYVLTGITRGTRGRTRPR